MRKFLLFFALLGAVAVSGCDAQDYLRKHAQDPEVQFAKDQVDLLRDGNIDALKGNMHASLLSQPNLDFALIETTRLISRGEIVSVELVNFSTGTTFSTGAPKTRRVSLELLYKLSESWLGVSAVVLQESDGPFQLFRFRLTPLSAPPNQSDQMVLETKGPIPFHRS